MCLFKPCVLIVQAVAFQQQYCCQTPLINLRLMVNDNDNNNMLFSFGIPLSNTGAVTPNF